MSLNTINAMKDCQEPIEKIADKLGIIIIEHVLNFAIFILS